MSDFEEGAKATQEIAKATGKAFDHIKDIERIGKALLGPIGEGWGLIGDWLRAKREKAVAMWRIDNRSAVYLRAEEALRQLGLSREQLRAVPQRIAYDYEEGLETEEEPTLQQLWANLLVNTTRPEGAQPKKIYASILHRLEPDDATLFSFIGTFPYLEHVSVGRPNVDDSARLGIGDADITALFIGHTEQVNSAFQYGYTYHSQMWEYGKANPLCVGASENRADVFFLKWQPQRTIRALDNLAAVGLVGRHHIPSGTLSIAAGRSIGEDEKFAGLRKPEGGPVTEEMILQYLAAVDLKVVYALSDLGRDFAIAVAAPTSPTPNENNSG